MSASTQSITIPAGPAEIMAVICDFAAYPQWAQAIKNVDIAASDDHGRASRVRYAMDAGLIKDDYELAYTYSNDGLSLSWELVNGKIQKAQVGSYVLAPTLAADGSISTTVTYTLTVELSIPLVGVLRRKAERTIMDTALTELRTRVVALAQ